MKDLYKKRFKVVPVKRTDTFPKRYIIIDKVTSSQVLSLFQKPIALSVVELLNMDRSFQKDKTLNL